VILALLVYLPVIDEARRIITHARFAPSRVPWIVSSKYTFFDAHCIFWFLESFHNSTSPFGDRNRSVCLFVVESLAAHARTVVGWTVANPPYLSATSESPC